MVGVTAFAFALGLLLVLAFATVIRYREQLEAARSAEVARLRSAAFTDNLTGLQNHRAFQEDLERRLCADDPYVSLVLIDLDGLKQANDLHGHQVGDECLIALGAAISMAAGDGDGAYRVGGDEFALLLDESGAVEALNAVQRLQATLGRTPSGLAVAATAGVTQAEAGCDRTGLMRRADLALIQAKRMNRGAMIYTPDLEPILQSPDEAEESRHRATLATALARAVDAKDAYTHSHCETVAELCAMIGHELGLEASHLSRLRLAGLLHDVGKIGITDSILHKPGPLTSGGVRGDEGAPEARARHRGGRGAARRGPLDPAPPRADRRRRLPAGLSGDRIPLESRIILVADAFEAITADRPVPAAPHGRRGDRGAAARGRDAVRCALRGGPGAGDRPPRPARRLDQVVADQRLELTRPRVVRRPRQAVGGHGHRHGDGSREHGPPDTPAMSHVPPLKTVCKNGVCIGCDEIRLKPQ